MHIVEVGGHMHEEREGMDLAGALLRALDSAAPDETAAVVRRVLARPLGVRDVRVLLSDHRLTALRVMPGPDRADTAGQGAEEISAVVGPAAEAFVGQRAVRRGAPGGATTVYVPVSVRGDRLGVLQLTLGTDGAAATDRLTQLATVIGYAVQASARHSDAVERVTRSERLTLAAEVQRQLLPGRGCSARQFRLAAHLEPAPRAHADNIDWSQDANRLTLAVTDAGPGGATASLVMTLAVAALRNARRAGLGPADQVRLADQAIYAHHRGRHHVDALVVGIDLQTGRAEVVRAGSPRMFILRGDTVLAPPLSDQLPLGMFEGTDYVAEQVALATGDRVLLVSDGVDTARSLSLEPFGRARLPALLQDSSRFPVGTVVRRVVEELHRHRGRDELDDDAAVICLDWDGPGSAGPPDEVTGSECRTRSRAPGPLNLVWTSATRDGQAPPDRRPAVLGDHRRRDDQGAKGPVW